MAQFDTINFGTDEQFREVRTVIETQIQQMESLWEVPHPHEITIIICYKDFEKELFKSSAKELKFPESLLQEAADAEYRLAEIEQKASRCAATVHIPSELLEELTGH